GNPKAWAPSHVAIRRASSAKRVRGGLAARGKNAARRISEKKSRWSLQAALSEPRHTRTPAARRSSTGLTPDFKRRLEDWQWTTLVLRRDRSSRSVCSVCTAWARQVRLVKRPTVSR